MSSEELTPVDRPLMRSDLNDVRQAVHEISEKTIKMYDATMAATAEMSAARSTFRVYVTLCVFASFLAIGGAVVSVVASASASTQTAHCVP